MNRLIWSKLSEIKLAPRRFSKNTEGGGKIDPYTQGYTKISPKKNLSLGKKVMLKNQLYILNQHSIMNQLIWFKISEIKLAPRRFSKNSFNFF